MSLKLSVTVKGSAAFKSDDLPVRQVVLRAKNDEFLGHFSKAFVRGNDADDIQVIENELHDDHLRWPASETMHLFHANLAWLIAIQ